MKRRIGLWALCGAVVATCWVIYSMASWPNNLGPAVRMAAGITAPASLIGRSVPLAYYWFIVLNALVYALLGSAVEPFRRLRR
jgi:hypothetical protein